MKKSLFLIVGGIILFSCTQKESKTSFTRDNFKKHTELNNSISIQLEDTYNDPASFYLIKDSLVLVNNQLHSDFLIEIYSIKTGKPILQLARKGQGPNEFSACLCYSISNQDSLFYIQDTEKHIFYSVDIEQTLKEKRLHIAKQFQYSADIHPYTRICLLDNEHYLGYNMWYLENKTYNNQVSEFSVYEEKIDKQDISQSTIDLQKYDYFVADVNGGNLFNVGNNIWLTDMHKAQITLYDKSLNVIKTLIGPDGYNIEYESKTSNIPMPFIVFKKEKYYSSYKYWTQTDKHVYIIYEHLIGESFDPEHLKPIEIFKFDFEGNQITHYKLDNYAYHISVDKQEKYLYATTRSSYKEPAKFVKYKLD